MTDPVASARPLLAPSRVAQVMGVLIMSVAGVAMGLETSWGFWQFNLLFGPAYVAGAVLAVRGR